MCYVLCTFYHARCISLILMEAAASTQVEMWRYTMVVALQGIFNRIRVSSFDERCFNAKMQVFGEIVEYLQKFYGKGHLADTLALKYTRENPV